MNYKLNYWNDLFIALIDIHLVNGNHFDSEIINCEPGSLMLERLDYSSENPIDFLRYTFECGGGGKVVYAVNNKVGGGTVTTLNQVIDHRGVIQQLDIPNVDAQLIMEDCFEFAVKVMKNIWFD